MITSNNGYGQNNRLMTRTYSLTPSLSYPISRDAIASKNIHLDKFYLKDVPKKIPSKNVIKQ